ncbi:DNA helicase-4 [Marinobacter sp. 3-2]|jgi:DNA helicase-4|uniref:UvrD-helicase domain-containing protein n=1 Tax=Marinobacter sp. 3-2 TaxID=2485141 RepID=UPI000D349DC9|nr:UvrD-helicase domain-containing protein [Marinobacter sp. 3-2]ROQ48467.1 DNA helicase-4 [Marinobacter sp. 3-2]
MSVFRQPWFLRLFAIPPLVCTISDKGLFLDQKNGPSRLIKWGQFSSGPVRRGGLFFSRIDFTVEGRNESITWLGKSTSRDLREHLYRRLIDVHGARAKASLSQVASLVDKSGYLRTSQAQAIAQFASSQKQRLILPPSDVELTKDNIQPFEELQQWAESDPALIEQIRNDFLAAELNRFKDLFDAVESNPLTGKQREACVIDEDNNLVLAGAGTGKTSTMIGRAAYLLKSRRAEDSDILMLAFGRKAADEMQDRIADKIPGASVKATTFHSLGLTIIGQVEGAKPKMHPLAEDDAALAKAVDNWLKELLEDSEYQEKAIQYFSAYLYPAKNCFDFSSEGEYFEYIRANNIVTLKSENVKSLEEAFIANWLFRMGVVYQYEAPYKAADTRTVDFRAYLPDFYLPDYDVYIEHFGVDREGGTAPFIDAAKYQEGIKWKRDLHRTYETTLVETFSYEQREGCLISELEKKLTALGVKFVPLPNEAILETLKEKGVISEFSQLLSQLLGAFKGSHETWEQVKERASRVENPGQFHAAMDLLKPIVDRYKALLEEDESIDFNDMIGRAIDYVESGRFKPSWRYIMVDEFQDISRPRARLVKVLRDRTKNCSVFCVGDDWQAIYRFTGSDVTLTTGFQKEFGPTKTTSLDKTFRFNNQICDVASKFVMKNPAQVKKRLTTHSVVSQPAVSIMRRKPQDRQQYAELDEVLQAISDRISEKATVYILGRFWFRLPDQVVLRDFQRKYPKLKIERLTFHASKGKEADYVVVMGLEVGRHGFPSTKETHPLLDALLAPEEPFKFAEERRLFYVALTRARHRVYLITDMSVASDFPKELINQNYQVELDEFRTDLNQLHADELSCPVCGSGTMVPRQGSSAGFYGCSNYPLCTNTDPGCPSCGGPMKQTRGFKICVNDTCGAWVPLCSECGAPMKKRKGPYGEFWGCSNYRKTPPSCSNKLNRVTPPHGFH